MTMNIKPAEGKLGVLCVGLGAVTTTLITGTLMARKGLANPVGSFTQLGKMRVGRGEKKQYLFPRGSGDRIDDCSVHLL